MGAAMATHKAKEQAKDVESLLEKTPLRDKDAHQELQMQLCGLPVQVVAGAAYCAGTCFLPAHPAAKHLISMPC